MSQIVILSEKPSQARAYSEAFSVKKRDKTSIELNPCSTFPSGAIITWGIGHLVELKEPKEYKTEWGSWNLSSLPILPNKYEFKVASGKSEQFNAVKKLFLNADTIINACDQDAEGSNIFYSIYHMTGAKNKVIKRLWVNSLEVDEVRKGFANLTDNQKDLLLYNRAKTRQIADWLVGMNGSRLYTLLLQQKGFKESLSIGRVQSPAVYLIYQRQLEIENFVPKPFFEIEADFTAAHGKYKGKAKIKSEKKEEVLNILNQHRITGKDKGFVKSVTKKEIRTKSPKLHALSTLQTVANKKWKYSPKQVLDTVQKLYDKKILSYPRTDTQFITDSEFAYLSKNLESYQDIIKNAFKVASREPKKRYVDGSKVQEHYAIIPTKTIPSNVTLQGLSPEERNIYFEVLNTTLAMFHEDYVFEETKVITDVNQLDFETTGKTEISKGWKELFNIPIEDEKESRNDATQALPRLEKDETVESIVQMKEGVTSPPKPYTEGQLIPMMKTCGKTVENEEEIEILKEIEGLGTEATRSGIIETIKKQQYIEVKKNIVNITEKGKILCQSIEGNLLSSPSMTAKWETYLKKIGNGTGSQEAFLGNITKFIHKLLAEVPEQLKTESITQSIETVQQSDIIAPCPACKKGNISFKRSFYGCSEYANGCKQTFPSQMLGKKVTEKHVKDLCTKKKTSVIKGMKPKAKDKKPFDASLILKDDGSIGFEFAKKTFAKSK
ncbi:type IA DNA topoisomerase [Peribacillus frigoritolerans]|uniref:type IA DNA topoisomerase n=1 Tax=Peribacillus frigoritolerans TaxID=450367 RepID=UPI00203EEB6D|nr:type IA DNA topoisomerase [Peribacillus frigoritolerans]MCM3169507.1 DNA topoisomerase III [Peribacillus frigoritolerans]